MKVLFLAFDGVLRHPRAEEDGALFFIVGTPRGRALDSALFAGKPEWQKLHVRAMGTLIRAEEQGRVRWTNGNPAETFRELDEFLETHGLRAPRAAPPENGFGTDDEKRPAVMREFLHVCIDRANNRYGAKQVEVDWL